jgi:hypothetical protein
VSVLAMVHQLDPLMMFARRFRGIHVPPTSFYAAGAGRQDGSEDAAGSTEHGLGVCVIMKMVRWVSVCWAFIWFSWLLVLLACPKLFCLRFMSTSFYFWNSYGAVVHFSHYPWVFPCICGTTEWFLDLDP